MHRRGNYGTCLVFVLRVYTLLMAFIQLDGYSTSFTLKSEDFQLTDFSKPLLSKVRMLSLIFGLLAFYSPHVLVIHD